MTDDGTIARDIPGKALNILFVTEFFPPIGQGGGEISCALFAKHLAKAGMKVTVLTSSARGLIEVERKDGYTIYRRVRSGKGADSFLSNIKRNLLLPGSVRKEIRRLLNEQPFDIIHYFGASSILGSVRTRIPQVVHVNSPVFFSPTGIITHTDKELLQKKVTFSIAARHIMHSQEIGRMRNHWWLLNNPLAWCWLYRALKRRQAMMKRMDHYIAPTPFMKERLKIIGVKNNNISIVPNIIEPTRAKIRSKSDGKLLRILYLGSFLEYKGPKVLLDSLGQLSVPYSCSFYGSGRLEAEMRETIRKRKLHATIKRPVSPDALHRVFKEHDVVVIPSLVTEGFGRIVVEANSDGVPVIASDTGGMHDLVKDGKNGVLVQPGDPGVLAEAMVRVGKDSRLRQRLISQGQRSAKGYAGRKVALMLLDSYIGIINQKR